MRKNKMLQQQRKKTKQHTLKERAVLRADKTARHKAKRLAKRVDLQRKTADAPSS